MNIARLWIVLSVATVSAASAQGIPVTISKRLAGWQCMALASDYTTQGANAPLPPVYAGPESSAPQVGTAGGVLIVPDPLHPTNGRTEMIWPNGKRVWIDVKLVTPWHSLNDPAAVCHPALLSNGRYGFTTTG
jgi:hypothetical protein